MYYSCTHQYPYLRWPALGNELKKAYFSSFLQVLQLLCRKTLKNRFWPAFGVSSTQTLVEIYNTNLNYSYFLLCKQSTCLYQKQNVSFIISAIMLWSTSLGSSRILFPTKYWTVKTRPVWNRFAFLYCKPKNINVTVGTNKPLGHLMCCPQFRCG